MSGPLVVIGASYAGTQIAFSARENGFPGEIVLLGAEPHPPYQRPPLSKGYLLGKVPEAALWLKGEAAFRKKGITLRQGVEVTAIDRAAREVVTGTGERIAYAKLALATGARVRRLTLPGADLAGVHHLRDLADARALSEAARTARRAVVIGGGFIGLETAASLSGLGLAVTVVEPEDRLLKRAVPPVLSDWLLALHRRAGVDVRLGAAPAAVCGEEGRVRAVTLAGGGRLPCELVVVGIGVDPDDRLARAAGLEVDSGVVVDIHALTSDPDIAAAGDCTVRPDRWAPGGSRRLRVQSVQNAIDQGKVAGASLAGVEASHTAVPWFWSDQFDAKLQIAGHGAPEDTVVLRGDPQSGSFSLYHFRDGRPVAVDSVNATQDHMVARKLLAVGAAPTPADVRDPSVALESFCSTGAGSS